MAKSNLNWLILIGILVLAILFFKGEIFAFVSEGQDIMYNDGIKLLQCIGFDNSKPLPNSVYTEAQTAMNEKQNICINGGIIISPTYAGEQSMFIVCDSANPDAWRIINGDEQKYSIECQQKYGSLSFQSSTQSDSVLKSESPTTMQTNASKSETPMLTYIIIGVLVSFAFYV